MSFRKEKKYRLSYSDMAKIESYFISINMKELYPARTINSCYFDNDNMAMFHDSEEGVLPRKKVRVRWYNDSQDFTREIKISSLEGRYKLTKAANDLATISNVISSNIFDPFYGHLSPILIVRYARHYFRLESLRITFDRNISYQNLKYRANAELQDSECVMEVKAPASCDDNYIENLIHHPTARFSKYSRGVLTLAL